MCSLFYGDKYMNCLLFADIKQLIYTNRNLYNIKPETMPGINGW